MVARTVFAAMGILCLVSSGAQSAGRRLPPVTDFFGSETTGVFRLSPSGDRVAFLRVTGDVSVLCAPRSEDAAADGVLPLTQPSDGNVFSFLWLDDVTLVFCSRTPEGGTQLGRVILSGDGLSNPSLRILVPAGEHASLEGLCVVDRAPEAVMSIPSKADSLVRDYFRIDPRTAERQLIYENQARLSLCAVSRNGRRLAGIRFDDGGHCELVTADANSANSRVLLRSAPGETLHLLGLDFSGQVIYLQSNVGAGVDLVRIEAVDWHSGRRRLLAEDPKGEVDVHQPVFDRASDQLLGVSMIRDRVEYQWTATEEGEIYSQIQSRVGHADVMVRDLSLDAKRWVISVLGDREPESDFLYDVVRGDLVRLSSRGALLPTEQLGVMESVQFKARDGQVIRGYLTFPPTSEKSKLPVVVFPHGGPHMRNTWGFDPRVQFLASRGYAVLQINFRGSTGFGKGFQRAGYRQWGKGVLQNDLSDGVEWLVHSGIADPKRIAIFGGSYGGFAALAGVTFTPDRFVAGISLFGPCDLPAYIEKIPPGWMPFKRDLTTKMGDPEDPADRRRLNEQSPMNAVDSLKVPLLIYQGAQDPIVRREQTDAMVSACWQAGKQVEYLVSPEGGHGFTDCLDEQAVYVAIERFLARHLMGWSDPIVPAEVQKRLSRLEGCSAR